MQTWSRKRIEITVLAILAVGSVIPLRLYVESPPWFVAEMVTLVLTWLVASFVSDPIGQSRTKQLLAIIATAGLVATPIVFSVAGRRFGSPIAYEMSALSTFGAVALALSVFVHRGRADGDRLGALSMIASGFLVLFAASIADNGRAVIYPMAWISVCVWHLIANHWERLDLAMPETVNRNWSLRPSVAISTLLVLGIGALVAKDRMPESKHITTGFMPTSGGHSWSDSAARGGVGTGDAAVAAKDHAESFGAVDSDVILESTESSLFDMASDMIGEPKKKTKWESRQAVKNENFISMHERASKSEQGGATFSTERIPPKKHHHFGDVKNDCVIQWDGPTGIRLAMQRYDTFDGSQWSQTADWINHKLSRVPIDETPWFFDPTMRKHMRDQPDGVSVGLVKIIRLNSQRIPVPMSTAGVHIKEIERQDFFGITTDGSFYMPSHKKIPPLTVVHVASVDLTEDEILQTLRPQATESEPTQNGVIAEFVADCTQEGDSAYTKLQSILTRLRDDFTFDRSHDDSATSISEFFRTRRGGDHLFATSAALMARQIGLSSRLVNGFYVRPDAFDITAGHSAVMPKDIHFWAEVKLDDGRWFEIEPTPGYQLPNYRPSWRLTASRFAAAYWPFLLGGFASLAFLHWTRAIWCDWLLTALWLVARWLRPRRRIWFAMQIIEARARLAGQRRPESKPQRAWLEQLTSPDQTIADAARRFSDAADAVCFGSALSPSGRDFGETVAPDAISCDLVRLLHVRTIHSLKQEAVQ